MTTTTDILTDVARATDRATDALTERNDAIRRALDHGATLRAIAEAAGVTHQTVANIRDRG